jgi:hypothetical protein
MRQSSVLGGKRGGVESGESSSEWVPGYEGVGDRKVKDVSSDSDSRDDGDVPELTLFEHKVLERVTELLEAKVKPEAILAALDCLFTVETISTIEQVKKSVGKALESVVGSGNVGGRGSPIVGVTFTGGYRYLDVETVEGHRATSNVARYLTSAYKILAIMIGQYSALQVVALHWKVFSDPLKVMTGIRRTNNARRRRFYTTVKAGDGFGIDEAVYPAVKVFDQDSVVALLNQSYGWELTSQDVNRIKNVLPHMYNFVSVIANEDRPGISEKVLASPMPKPPEDGSTHKVYREYAQYFYDNYFKNGVGEPLMFFSVVLRDYILDGQVAVVRQYLHDTSGLYKTYKRVLTIAIEDGAPDMKTFAVGFQGKRLSSVPGVQEIKAVLAAEVYSYGV